MATHSPSLGEGGGGGAGSRNHLRTFCRGVSVDSFPLEEQLTGAAGERRSRVLALPSAPERICRLRGLNETWNKEEGSFWKLWESPQLGKHKDKGADPERHTYFRMSAVFSSAPELILKPLAIFFIYFFYLSFKSNEIVIFPFLWIIFTRATRFN